MGIQDDAAVTCAAYRVTENGQTWYFTTLPGEELLDTAQMLRRYCTSTEHSTGKFISLYLHARPITSEEYQQLMQLRMENTGEVAGVGVFRSPHHERLDNVGYAGCDPIYLSGHKAALRNGGGTAPKTAGSVGRHGAHIGGASHRAEFFVQ